MYQGIVFCPPPHNPPLPVTLSLQRPKEENNGVEYEDPFPLLEIPYNLVGLYSTKPRKWLLYCGYAISGSEGVLRFSGDNNNSNVDLEQGINPGDHYIYRSNKRSVLVDIGLRDKTRSTSVSQSRPLVDNLCLYYGGCPFSHVMEFACQACHLVPHAKGDEVSSDPFVYVDVDN